MLGFDLGAIDRFEQRLARRKVAVQGAGADTSLLRDVVQVDFAVRSGKGIFRHLEDALAVSLRVCSRLSRGGFGTFRCHLKFFCNRRPSPIIYYSGDILRFIWNSIGSSIGCAGTYPRTGQIEGEHHGKYSGKRIWSDLNDR